MGVNHKDDKKIKLLQKILMGVVLLSAVIAFRVFDLGQYFTLSYIKTSQERFALLYANTG